MHGTAVAGVIAAEADGRGTVGVAWGATIAGVDHFYDPSLDADRSFLRLSSFDVTNHSWGFTKPFSANVADPAFATFFAGWQRSVVEGRGGLGTVNVVSAGNDRAAGRDANHSNLSNMPEAITVAAVGLDGDVAAYSTPGACVLVAAPSNDWLGGGIWTTDRTGAAGYSNGWNEPDNRDAGYTASFGGTSAAAPAVSGVVALMLEANPELGWRDVQEILALSARHVGSPIGAGPWGTSCTAGPSTAPRPGTAEACTSRTTTASASSTRGRRCGSPRAGPTGRPARTGCGRTPTPGPARGPFRTETTVASASRSRARRASRSSR